MIKDKELKDNIIEDFIGDPNLADMSLEELAERFNVVAPGRGIPATFEVEELRIGNALKNTTGKVLVLRHPEHINDYYGICIMLKNNGGVPCLNAYFMGNSKQLGIEEKQDKAKVNRYNRVTKSLTKGQRNGTGIFGTVQSMMITGAVNLGSAVASGVRAIQHDDNAANAEEAYYAQCIGLLKAVLNN